MTINLPNCVQDRVKEPPICVYFVRCDDVESLYRANRSIRNKVYIICRRYQMLIMKIHVPQGLFPPPYIRINTHIHGLIVLLLITTP